MRASPATISSRPGAAASTTGSHKDACRSTGWDSDCVQLLNTQTLRAFRFLLIRQNRSKAQMDARNAHAAPYARRTWHAPIDGVLDVGRRGRFRQGRRSARLNRSSSLRRASSSWPVDLTLRIIDPRGLTVPVSGVGGRPPDSHRLPSDSSGVIHGNLDPTWGHLLNE